MKTKKEIKQLIDSFCLQGKITEKHAKDIEKILEEFLRKEKIPTQTKTKKDLDKLILWAKSEIEEWKDFIKQCEKRFKRIK